LILEEALEITEELLGVWKFLGDLFLWSGERRLVGIELLFEEAASSESARTERTWSSNCSASSRREARSVVVPKLRSISSISEMATFGLGPALM
jgi:hypothetical protein